VFLKFAWAIPFNPPILRIMEKSLSHDVYLVLGCLYIGALTGVFEVGITLIGALLFKQIAKDSTRAVGVGAGAGAIEAVLLGIFALLGVLAVVLTTGSTRHQLLTAIGAPASPTPMLGQRNLWLIELAIAPGCNCRAADHGMVYSTLAQATRG
jgi:uncharacterized membrane protein YhfC